MPEQITILNGGESPLAFRAPAAGSSGDMGAASNMQLNGGAAPTPSEGAAAQPNLAAAAQTSAGQSGAEQGGGEPIGEPPLGGVVLAG